MDFKDPLVPTPLPWAGTQHDDEQKSIIGVSINFYRLLEVAELPRETHGLMEDGAMTGAEQGLGETLHPGQSCLTPAPAVPGGWSYPQKMPGLTGLPTSFQDPSTAKASSFSCSQQAPGLTTGLANCLTVAPRCCTCRSDVACSTGMLGEGRLFLLLLAENSPVIQVFSWPSGLWYPDSIVQHLKNILLKKKKKTFVHLALGLFCCVFSFSLPSAHPALQFCPDSPAGLSRLGESPFQKIKGEILLHIHSKNKTALYFWSIFLLLISKILEILN